jgi:hypothetical protein
MESAVSTVVNFLAEEWEVVLVVFYCLEKIVKLSPTDKDDILLDVVFSGVKKLVASMVGKEKK